MNTALLKDHRQIGLELDLFSFHKIAPGCVFWHPKGWIIYRTLLEFIREKTEKDGYLEISTPVMVKNTLFKKSGHWQHFGEHNMFNLAIYDEEDIQDGNVETVKIKIVNKSFEVPQVNYSLKPMNCPEAALVYGTHTRSYQDLPIKLSEFGILHRRELSGVLGGLLRVRQFTIDDAHLFVRDDQINKEIQKLLMLVIDVYKSLNFKPKFYLSTRPDKAMGDKKTWDMAENSLKEALTDSKVNFGIKPKDGAFYGPKIDIHIEDSQSRDWQLATIQLDFQMPKNMDLNFINKEGKKEKPVMIHQGIFGSLERFIGILTEHFQGKFPTWLAPVQVEIIPITDRNLKYANQIEQKLKNNLIRTNLNGRSETMQSKIREASHSKIPYLLIVGDKEENQKTISIRSKDAKQDKIHDLDQFIKLIKQEIEMRQSSVVS